MESGCGDWFWRVAPTVVAIDRSGSPREGLSEGGSPGGGAAW